MAFCHECGNRLESGDRFCTDCGTLVRGAEPATPGVELKPGAHKPPAAVLAGAQPVTEYQGVGIRFIAQIVDSIVVLILFLIVGYLVAVIAGGSTQDGFELHGAPALAAILLTTVLSIAYFTLLEAFWNGQTLGKKLTRIRVVNEDGTDVDLTAALVRNVARIVDGFAFYLVGAIFVWTSPARQRLGDKIGRTVVVKAAAKNGTLIQNSGTGRTLGTDGHFHEGGADID